MSQEKKQFQLKIGGNVKSIRESKGISLKELAYDCGYDKSFLSRLENGRTNPTIFTLKKIADKLGITVAELVSV